MTNREWKQCALEAIQAHGDTNRGRAWIERWCPEEAAFNRRDRGDSAPTTVQYSLSCIVMDYARKLLEAAQQQDTEADASGDVEGAIKAGGE